VDGLGHRMSGTGKESAIAELQASGFRVVDTDEPVWGAVIPAVRRRS